MVSRNRLDKGLLRALGCRRFGCERSLVSGRLRVLVGRLADFFVEAQTMSDHRSRLTATAEDAVARN